MEGLEKAYSKRFTVHLCGISLKDRVYLASYHIDN